MSEKAFTLPGNYYLAYGYAWTKGTQVTWNNFNVTSTFNAKLESNYKKDCIKLGCWSSNRNTYYDRRVIIMADFDHLYDKYNSFDKLAKFMHIKYCHKGLVIRSFSNKVKIAFVVHLSKGQDINQENALETLKTLLDEEDYNEIDKSLGALSLHFMTKSAYSEFKENIINKPVHNLVEKVKVKHIYRQYNGEIPQYFQYFISNDSKREKFVRILLASKMLAYEGFNLPTKKLASEVEVDPTTISAWIKQLKNIGLLVCVDENYVIGKKAKTFKACNEFLEFFNIKQVDKEKSVLILPSYIEDGNWYKMLYIGRCLAKNDILYKKWYETLPNNHLKDRKRMFNNNLKELRRIENAG